MRYAGISEIYELDCSRDSLRGEIGRPFDGAALWKLAERASTFAPDIYTFLCEAVGNVHSHAYPRSAQRPEWLGWEASIRIDRDLLVYSVRDHGVGIPASVKVLYEELSLDPVQLIRLAVTPQSSREDQLGRGRGLPSMVSLTHRRRGCRLDVQSSGHLLSFSDAFPQGNACSTRPGVGTVISISVPLEATREHGRV